MTETAETPVTARRAQTRDRLMTAAIGAFAERGIFGSSVEDICEAAGFTRGAFYSNFASKDELVLALLRHEIETQYAAAQQAIEVVKGEAARGWGTRDVLSTAVAAFETAGRMDREWVLTQQELLLYAARRPEVREPYRAFSEEYLQHFGTLIAEGLAATGIEFTLDFPDAIALLTSCHLQDHLQGLLTGGGRGGGEAGGGASRLELLLRVITRPASLGHLPRPHTGPNVDPTREEMKL